MGMLGFPVSMRDMWGVGRVFPDRATVEQTTDVEYMLTLPSETN